MKRLFEIFALVGVILAASVPASADPVDGGHARVDFVSEREVATPGETVWLGFEFDMDPKWHIYWKNAGDAGIPPAMYWDENTSLDESRIGEISWPTPELIPVVDGEIMDYGYSNRVTLPFPVQVPENQTDMMRFGGTLDYLICEDICIPERVELELYLDVGPVQVPDLRGAELIGEALADVPPSHDGMARLTEDGDNWILSVTGDQIAGTIGTARFFPETHDIVHAADQPAEFEF